MDSTDIRILEILSADAGITDTALSKEISLSVPAANKRVAKLCENGYIAVSSDTMVDAASIEGILASFIAIFTLINFMASKFWVFYDD